MKSNLLMILLLLLLAAYSFAAPQQQKPLALTHVTVIDGTGSRPRSDQTVIIRGNRIREIGKTSEVKVPAGAQVVRGGGGEITACGRAMRVRSPGSPAYALRDLPS